LVLAEGNTRINLIVSNLQLMCELNVSEAISQSLYELFEL